MQRVFSGNRKEAGANKGWTAAQKIVGMGVIPLLLKIVNGGRNKNMMRYALGALRNLAMESTVQKLMVKEGVLDALVNVWELFGDDDTFADGSMPQEHAACVLRNLCIDDDVRHTVRKSNKLQSLSRIADPASPPILEEYVTVKPDLTPHEVMSYSLCRGGGVVKQRFGTTDDEFNAFPVGKYQGALNCDHLENDESAQHAWECLLDVMNELYLTFEAPHENAVNCLPPTKRSREISSFASASTSFVLALFLFCFCSLFVRACMHANAWQPYLASSSPLPPPSPTLNPSVYDVHLNSATTTKLLLRRDSASTTVSEIRLTASGAGADANDAIVDC
jgi:hypothetical protein